MPQETPNWVPDVSKYKNSPSRVLLRAFNGGFTAPFRGDWVAESIDKYTSNSNKRKVNYLEVGVGGSSTVIACPYEPYHIASAFEQSGVDYSGLIIDRSRPFLDNFINRTRIFYTTFLSQIHDIDPEMMEEGWNAYLNRTRQHPEVIHKDHPQLAVNDLDFFPLSRILLKSIALFQGIEMAKVSPIFTAKLQSGEVSVLQDDVTRARLEPYGPFDIGICMNVLYYLNPDGQKIAVNNMVSNIAPGGILIYNDSGKLPILEEHGGWLDSHKKQQLGLSIDESVSHGRVGGHTVVLKKE